MHIDSLLNELRDTRLGSLVRGESGSAWWFPNIETIHVLAITVVVGSILMLDLRLLGLSSRESNISRLFARGASLYPGAFAMAAPSGGLLFISMPDVYFYDLQIRLKFLFMVMTGLNMLIFHRAIYRRVQEWDDHHRPPLGRVAGLLSIALRSAVVFMGRWNIGMHPSRGRFLRKPRVTLHSRNSRRQKLV